ncbi:hypothetical protein FM076_17655 [Streptomyces albus subsp. chlorinus]|uniref:hypothetical protein n=1 Tax=Streptomyces albus TaxID=1888 RepID=UPI00156F9FE3|nr:hypothetical protein [Streptomyces albus]NSC22899.1 hypothetical protein [Streptomyces albus subsp. chlorinus]
MTDPINSQYDSHPLQPPPDDDSKNSDEQAEANPDKGKDFSGEIPALDTAWDKLPSFNDKPPLEEQSGGGGEKPTFSPDTNFTFKAGEVREAEQSMLNSTRTAVDGYEELRTKFLAEKDHVFGQGLRHIYDTGGPGASGIGLNASGDTTQHHDEPADFNGDEFGATMVPMMEKALAQVGSVLAATGEYIAMINIAGQMYSQADRDSRFPPPPGG